MILKAGLLLLAANGLAAALNYSFHLLAAGFLPPAEFGLLESFSALNYFLAVFISAFSLTAVNFANSGKILERFGLKLTLTVWLGFLAAYPVFKTLLHLTDPLVYFIFSLQLLWAFLPALYSSLIQARLKFALLALIVILPPLLKLGLGALFLKLDWLTGGAVGAMALTGLINWLIVLLLARKILRHKPMTAAKKLRLAPLFKRFFTRAFLTQFGLTSLYSTDMLLVRFFLPDQSGSYASAALFARIIFFAAAPILTVAYPLFSLKQSLKKNFSLAFLLTAAIGGAGIIYYRDAGLIFSFARLMLLFSLFNLCCQFLLAIDKRSAAGLTLSTAGLQILLITFNHRELAVIINCSTAAVGTGLSAAMYLVIKTLYAAKA